MDNNNLTSPSNKAQCKNIRNNNSNPIFNNTINNNPIYNRSYPNNSHKYQ